MAQMASDQWVFKFYKVRSPTPWPFEESFHWIRFNIGVSDRPQGVLLDS